MSCSATSGRLVLRSRAMTAAPFRMICCSVVSPPSSTRACRAALSCGQRWLTLRSITRRRASPPRTPPGARPQCRHASADDADLALRPVERHRRREGVRHHTADATGSESSSNSIVTLVPASSRFAVSVTASSAASEKVTVAPSL